MPKGFPNNTDERVFSPDNPLPSYGDEDTVEEVLAKRKKTGGRLSGTPNHQKKFELKKTAQLYGLRAIATMIEIMEDEDNPPTVRLQAANDIVDRGFGKATQTVEHGGIDGNEIQSRLVIEFVGQIPQVSDSRSTIGPQIDDLSRLPESMRNPNASDSATLHNVDSALNSPFRNAQMGRAPWTPGAASQQDITDVIHKTVSVPVFTNPWDSKK